MNILIITAELACMRSLIKNGNTISGTIPKGAVPNEAKSVAYETFNVVNGKETHDPAMSLKPSPISLKQRKC